MTVVNDELTKAFNELFLASFKRTLQPARLGAIQTPPDTYKVDVPGRPGYVYISKGDNGELGEGIAKDAVGVDTTATFQRIGVRREGKELVIREAEFLTGSVSGAVNLGDLLDVELTGLTDGSFIIYDALNDIWIPYNPGDEGPLVLHALSDTAFHSGQLADGQFLNALLRDGSRSLTGNLSVAAGITIDGIDIDAHAANPNAHHDEATSGNVAIGVTGQAISLVLPASSGLELVGGVRINLAADSGLVIDSSGLYLDEAIAGAGLSMSGTRVLSLNLGEGLEFTGDDVRVDEDNAFIWTNTHQFNADPQINSDLNFMGVARSVFATNTLTLRPTGNLVLNPTVDLRLDPSGLVLLPDSQEVKTDVHNDFVAGITGYRHWDLGGNHRMLAINKIKADELHVRVFSADEQRVSRGAQFWARSFGIVETTFDVPADEANVDVWFEEAPDLADFALFLANNWIQFRTIDQTSGLITQTVWFQVVGVDPTDDWITREDEVDAVGGEPAHVSRQQWRLKRKSGGFTGERIKKGSVGVDFGQPFTATTPLPGQGVVHLSALTEDGGPFIQIQTFESVSSDFPVFKNRVRMGNLSGTLDYSGNIFGLAGGNDISIAPSTGNFSGFALDQVNGLRIFNANIDILVGTARVISLDKELGLRLLTDTAYEDNESRAITWWSDLESGGVRVSFWPFEETAGVQELYIYNKHEGAGDWAKTSVIAQSVDSQNMALLEISSEEDGHIYFATPNVVTGGSLGVFDMGLAYGFDVGELNPFWGPRSAPLNPRLLPQARLHVRDTPGSYYTGKDGILIEATSTIDSVIRWWLSTPNVYYTAGIDNSDGDKFKISLGQTLGTNDIFIFDPTTGATSIPGFDYDTSPPPVAVTGGDGIDIVGSTVSVDATVVRTTTAIFAGNGLTGGGGLTGDVTLDVGAGDGITVTANQVALASSVAGTGLSFSLGVLSLSTALGGLGLTYSAGVLNIDPTLAGAGLDYASGVMSLSPSVAGMGLDYTSGVLSLNPAIGGIGLIYTTSTGVLKIDPTLAGTGLEYDVDKIIVDPGIAGAGLLYTSGILSVEVAASGGLQILTDVLSIKHGNSGASGLWTDVTGTWIHRRGNLGINSGISLTEADGIYIYEGLAGAGLTWGVLTERILAVGAGAGISVGADSVAIALGANSGLSTTSGLVIASSFAGAGLALTAGVLSVNVASGIAISGDDVILASTVAGTGLAYLAGVLSVNVSDGLTTSADNIILAPSSAGAGLDYSSGVLSVNAATGLVISGDNVILAPSAAGAGIAYASGVLNIGATDASINVAVNSISVNRAFDYTWTGDHVYSSPGSLQIDVVTQFNNNINFMGPARTITSASDLILQPTGNLLLSQSGDFRTPAHSDLVTGITGIRFFERSTDYWQLTMGALKIDELYARVFVADEVRIDRGEEYWSKSYGIVETEFTLPADEGEIDVWFEEAPALASAALFSLGDWLLFRTIDLGTGITISRIWFQVVNGGGLNGWVAREDASDGPPSHVPRQQWRIHRQDGGTTGQTVNKGSLALDAGSVGQGWIHLSALSQDGGPFLQIGDMTSIVSDVPVFTNRVRMGNLSGVAGISGTFWGFAAGDNLALTPASGFSGLTVGKGVGSPGNTYDGLNLYNVELELYSGGQATVALNKDWGLLLSHSTAVLESSRSITWVTNPASPDVSSQPYSRISTVTSVDVTNLNFYSQHEGGDPSITFRAYSSSPDQGQVTLDYEKFNVNMGSFGSKGFLKIQSEKMVFAGDREITALSTFHVYEFTSFTSTQAGITIEQAGAGDSVLHWLLGSTYFSMGIDNSASGNPLRISAGADLSITPLLTLDNSGNLSLAGTLAAGDTTVTGFVSLTTILSTPVIKAIDNNGVQIQDNGGNVGLTVVDEGRVVVVASSTYVEPYVGFDAQNNRALFVRQSTATSASTPIAMIVMSNNQTGTASGNIASLNFMNEAIATTDRRAGQFLVRTDGALNSTEYLFRVWSGGAVVESMTLKSSGFVGFLNVSPSYPMDVRIPSSLSQFHLSHSSADTGLYLTVVSSTNAFLGLSAYNGSANVAKATSSAQIQFLTGDVIFYGSTGLTAGSTFTPTERARVTSAGIVQASAGLKPTSSSDAITFFDEGTWALTFTASGSNPSATFSSADRNFTRINNKVTFQVYMATNSYSGGSGTIRISLPIAGYSTGPQIVTVRWKSSLGTFSGTAVIPASTAYLSEINFSGYSSLQASDITQAVNEIWISGSYYV